MDKKITISRDELISFGINCVQKFLNESAKSLEKSKPKRTKHRNPRRRKTPNPFLKP